GLGVLVDGLFKTLVIVVGDETGFDALAGEGVDEEIIGAAIQLGDGDDVIANAGNGLDGIGDGGHAGGEGQSGDAAFHFGDARFENRLGGVHDTGIDIARDLQVKQVSAVLGVVE